MKKSNIQIVAVGASAGGLEALQEFFKKIPIDTGLTFIVIQHLSPDYKSLMDELLARCTKMLIKVIENAIGLEANTIYLNPPSSNLFIKNDKIYTENYDPRKSFNLPIDYFFRSLAAEKGKNSIAIILSGTGSDGTLGIKAIKEVGGIVMVQDLNSAKFDGMPKNAISTGLADFILSPEKMAEALVEFLRHPLTQKVMSIESFISKYSDAFNQIIGILIKHSNIDFSNYKENTIIRRLERRLSINRFEKLDDYVKFLNSSDEEQTILSKELLIGVTRFFRDKEAFDSLKAKVFPKICNQPVIRIWSAACSSGEEVYSLAIYLKEYLLENNINAEVKIFATDIDRNAVEYASKGVYPDSIITDVETRYISRYFTKHNNVYQVNDNIRKMIVFATHNVIEDAPFSKLDLIVCRNLFIYFKPEVQHKILSFFYYSLNKTGHLFIGSSETVGDLSEAFEPVDSKWKIYYKKKGYTSLLNRGLFLKVTPENKVKKETYSHFKVYERQVNENLFEAVVSSYLPPTVIIDKNNLILHLINDVSKYIKVQPGVFSQNLFNNMSNELAISVSSMLRKIKSNHKDETLEKIVKLKNDDKNFIKIECRQLDLSKSYFLISFKEEVITSDKNQIIETNYLDDSSNEKIDELNKELQFTKENLQATVEELETSNEELQSSNEELIASNEELQSTNEELHSVNEELYTVNNEYQLKIDELIKLNNDVNNLLLNTELGALYLDKRLMIRKITPKISEITNIIESDIGRPITHLNFDNFNFNIIDDIKNVIKNLVPVDKEVLLNNGLYYLCRIRPYRSEFNAVDGILVTFVEITKLHEAYHNLKISNKRLNQALDFGKMAWWEWNTSNNELVYDDRKALMLGYKPDNFPKSLDELNKLIHPKDIEFVKQIQKNIIEKKINNFDISYRIKAKNGRYIWYYKKGEISESKKDTVCGIIVNITDLKKLESNLKQTQELLKQTLEISFIAQTMLDSKGRIIYANKHAEKLFNLSKKQITNRSYDSSKWEITDLDNNIIDPKDLPFSIVKNTKLPVYNYKHYIKIPNRNKVLLSVTGIPVIDENYKFQGAIFSIGEENE